MTATEPITIVSGLPRSGTSMMMSMLQAGGRDLLVDGVRTADEDNPKGYFEFERVKQVATDRAWLPEAEGKVVKIITRLLFDLPTDRPYKVVFMRRRLEEVLASQAKMLDRRGEDADAVADEEMRRMYVREIEQTEAYLRDNDCFDVLFVSYNRVLADPARQIERLGAFFDGALDAAAMQAMVDQRLYRNR